MISKNTQNGSPNHHKIDKKLIQNVCRCSLMINVKVYNIVPPNGSLNINYTSERPQTGGPRTPIPPFDVFFLTPFLGPRTCPNGLGSKIRSGWRSRELEISVLGPIRNIFVILAYFRCCRTPIALPDSVARPELHVARPQVCLETKISWFRNNEIMVSKPISWFRNR